MAEIHFLLSRSNGDKITCHLNALSRAIDDGLDLGPRSAHIQAGGYELTTLLVELQQLRDLLEDSPEVGACNCKTLIDQLGKLAEHVDALARLARTFPA